MDSGRTVALALGQHASGLDRARALAPLEPLPRSCPTTAGVACFPGAAPDDPPATVAAGRSAASARVERLERATRDRSRDDRARVLAGRRRVAARAGDGGQ